MKRGIVVAVGAAAFVAAGITGCTSHKDESDKATTTTASANNAGSGAKIVIDGKDQAVEGTVVCQSSNGNVNIIIGNGATGFGAVVTEGDSPKVKSAGLGSLNGASLAFNDGTPGASANAVKDGNRYTISGVAISVNAADPQHPVSKPFEIQVSCP